MLIDLINLAHNKPIEKLEQTEGQNKKENKSTILKIGVGIVAASFILMIAMIQLEKSNEKSFKFTEKSKKSDGRKPTETFTRTNLKKPPIESSHHQFQKVDYKKEKLKGIHIFHLNQIRLDRYQKNVNQLRKLCPLLRQVK